MRHFLRTALLGICFIFYSQLSYGAVAAEFNIVGKASGCMPFAVSFEDKSTGGVTSWSWTFGDGKTSVLASPSTTYASAGTFTVTLTVKDATGATSSKSRTIIVYGSPTVSYSSSPPTACPCSEITFRNSSIAGAPGAYTSKWSFGDGNTASTNDARYTYCTPGSYNIALQVTNSSGCTSSRLDTAKVVIHEAPDASFNATRTNLCHNPDSTQFNSTVTKGKPPYTYSWDFGDLGTSTLPNPKHNYGPGSFTVRLIVTDANGCKDTVSKTDYIKSGPVNSDMRMPAAVCQGGSGLLFENISSPTPAGTRWSWSDGKGGSGPVMTRDFWESGTFTLTMTDSFSVGCLDTSVKTFTVHPKPRAIFSYSPIYPCPAPAEITFVNKSRGADSFTWIFGDGTTSRLKDPIHTYTSNKMYLVFLVAKNAFGCLDTFRVRDTTKAFPLGYPKPYYDSSNSPVLIRVVNQNIMVGAPVTGFGGCLPFKFSAVATLCNPGGIVYPRGPGAACGATGYVSPPFWPCAGPVPGDAYPDEYADPYIIPMPEKDKCFSKSTPSPPYPITSYYWEFGDGATSTLDSPSHTYTTEGIFKGRITITTHNGCTLRDSFTVTAGNKPHAFFTMTPSEICIHDTVVLQSASSGGVVYSWHFGDDAGASLFTDPNERTVHRYHVSDTLHVALIADRYGCIDSMQRDLIVRPPQAFPDIIYSCDTPLKVRFGDSSVGATSVLWRFGDGATSTARHPVHTYAAAGSYTVRQVVYNSIYGCSDSIDIGIKVFQPLRAFTALDTTLCIGDSLRLNSVPQTYFEAYKWRIDTFTFTDTTANIRFRMKDTGWYTVVFTARDEHLCLDSVKREHYVIVGKPQMKALATPAIGCAPMPVIFRDLSTDTKGAYITSRKWLFGDASSRTTTSDTTSHTYPPGTYKVTLYATDNIGCMDSMNLTIESRRPTVAFTTSSDSVTCVGRKIKFYNGSSGVDLKYQWYFGDGSTSADKNPEYAYSTIGTFTVKLIVTDASGCKDSLIKVNHFRTTRPKASFDMSDSVALCPPLFVSFTNTTSADGIIHFWDFDNGSTSVVRDPVAPFIDSGIYHVILVATDKYGCTDTARARARVMGYDGALKYTPMLGCAPLTVDFEAELITADVMVWDFADGVTENAVGKLKTRHTYVTPGKYVPQLILGDGKGCSTSSKGLDTITVDDVIPLIRTSPACIGETITLTDSSKGVYSDYASSDWLLDDGSKSTSRSVTRRYDKPGSYPIRLISTNTNGCIDTLYQNLVVHALPLIKVDDTVICLNDAATLLASGGVSYDWQPDPTLSCTNCAAPQASPRVLTRYYVTGTDANGCKNTDTVTVGIKTKTKLIFDDQLEVCEKTPVVLQVSGAQTYTWIPPLYLDDANKQNPTATLDTSITYLVIGREGSCIPDTAKIRAVVHPLPEVHAGDDQRVLAGTMVSLNGNGARIKDYLWQPGDSLVCPTCPATQYRAQKTMTFTLKGFSDYGCVDSDDVTIVVFCDQSQLFIPNTFTPNGDGQNDVFYPQGSGVGKVKAFRIYNRWGQLVFERMNMDVNARDQGWDGTFKGEQLSPDVYVYTLEAACDNGEQIFWKGDIAIIR